MIISYSHQTIFDVNGFFRFLQIKDCWPNLFRYNKGFLKIA